MDLIEALSLNATKLGDTAKKLSERIDLYRSRGHDTEATIRELHNTCSEIGRLNDAIKSLLVEAER